MKLLKFEQNACPRCVVLDNILKHEYEVEVDEVVNFSTGGDDALIQGGMYGIMNTPALVLVDEEGALVERLSFTGSEREAVSAILTKRGLI